jgi:hypothetical protein
MWRRVQGWVHSWLCNPEPLAFAGLILLHLIPIWGFTYFPSQDGPAHLHNATVIRDYSHPDRPIYREYYLLDLHPDPNWLIYLILAGLLFLVPVLVAEKLLLTGYVILLPIALRYALQAINPASAFLSVLAFPLVYNFTLHMGFYNFAYSLPLYGFVLGYWLRHHDCLTPRTTLTLATLALLLYMAHPVSLVAAWLAIGTLACWLTLLDGIGQVRQQRTLRPLWTACRPRVLMTLGAFLPTLLLMGVFVGRQGLALRDSSSAAHLWSQLQRLDVLISYRGAEAYLSSALFWLFVLLVVYLLFMKGWCRQVSRWDGMFAVAAGYVALYFLAPEGVSGGWFLSARLQLYPCFALLLWFAVHNYARPIIRAIQVVAVGLAVLLLGIHIGAYAELNDYLDEYLSGMPLMAPNTTLLSLSFSYQGHTPDGRVLAWRINPFLHAGGYIAAHRGLVDLLNYSANSDWFPLFPLRFRPELNPFRHLVPQHDARLAREAFTHPLEWEPPAVDFLSYAQRTGGRADYVLVWHVRSELREHPDTHAIFHQLEQQYVLLYTSPQRGFMRLYQRQAEGTEQ